MKKGYSIFLPALSLVLISGCSQESETKGSLSEKNDSNECYEQCETWGGGDENVKMCKENCDASSDKDSVWNKDHEDYESDDSTGGVWPSTMPTEVPEFKYGTPGELVEGMGSWIIDLENVEEGALENYESDLESAGWSASYTSINNSLTGKLEGKYTISIMHDTEYKTAQIIVRKSS